jgi:hypothetical protein
LNERSCCDPKSAAPYFPSFCYPSVKASLQQSDILHIFQHPKSRTALKNGTSQPRYCWRNLKTGSPMKRVRISDSKNSKPARPEANDIDSLLGAPPLFRGEDRKAYNALRDRVRNFAEPKDIIEEFWTRDVVDLI